LKAWIQLTADDECRFYVNGQKVGKTVEHSYAEKFDISQFLKAGGNTITFEVINSKGPYGLIYCGSISAGGKEIRFISSADTLFPENGKDGWVKSVLMETPPVEPWGEISIMMETQ